MVDGVRAASIDRLAGFLTDGQAALPAAGTPVDVLPQDPPARLPVVHDWEDDHLLEHLDTVLAPRELVPVPAAAADSPEVMEAAEVGVFWTAAARTSPEISNAILDAIARTQRAPARSRAWQTRYARWRPAWCGRRRTRMPTS